MKKTFILGAGAQKAGTTWLAQYLAASPGVAAGAMKGYHVWNALHVPACREFIVPDPTLLEVIRDRMFPRRESRAESFSRSRLRWRMQNRTATYFDYFADQLQAPGKHIAYDLTPAYSSLPPKAFATIADGFSGRGIDTKAVLLMRDPVERCWSAARMAKQHKTGKTDVAGEEVLHHALSGQAEIRTRYDLTISALRAVFAEDRIYTGLYEEMHGEVKIIALSAFCGVAANPGMRGKRVNARAKTSILAPAIQAKIARHYRQVYDMAASAFPQARELWPGYRYL